MEIPELLEQVRDHARTRGVRFMDARYFAEDTTSVIVEDGRADTVGQRTGAAAGIRVLADDAWGFASTDVLTARSFDETLGAAIEMARSSKERILEPGAVATIVPVVDVVRAEVEHDPREVALAEKVHRTSEYERAGTRAGGDRIANSRVSYGDGWTREVVCNTFGTLIDQQTIRTYLSATYTAADGSTRQRASESAVERTGFELLDRTPAEELSIRAARDAVYLLDAQRCPSGRFTVILDPSVAGVFAHEVLGHNAEGDHVFAGMSIIAGKEGQRIGSDHVSIYDDATIPRASGSYAYDSEGVPGQKRTIIERGILTGFLHSLETAARLGAVPNGNGRAQDAHRMPLARMSNTYFAPGEASLDDLIRGIETGILIEDSQGGYVHPERGQYTCRATKGRMIRNGALAETLRQVTFTGVLIETLMNVDGVSREFRLWPGMCGKGGQSVPVTTGGPYVRIRDIVVGGQERGA